MFCYTRALLMNWGNMKSKFQMLTREKIKKHQGLVNRSQETKLYLSIPTLSRDCEIFNQPVPPKI